MCLIAYVPDGRELDADVYTSAFKDNSDGIGIMSRLGVVRFLGAKMLKKARRYVRVQLAPQGIEYAIHFRFATHGDVNIANTHPFALPDNKSYLMHNGVISWCGYDDVRSDTGVFADLLDDYPGQVNEKYLKELGTIIGYGNKFCIMNADGSFSLVNADSGIWDKGIWYSNTYSLPARLDPWQAKGSSYELGTSGRSNVLSFGESESWLRKFDADNLKRTGSIYPASSLDFEDDVRLTPVRDDDGSNLHGGCGLPVPHGYRITSQEDYYASLELDADDTDLEPFGFTQAELEQMELDDALLEMRAVGGI